MPSPQSGQDVTQLMAGNTVPKSGDDVTHLMGSTALGSSSPSLPTAGTVASGLAPASRTIAEELATNPNTPKVAAQIGRILGGIAPAVGGAAEAGPMGGIVGLAAAAKGAWAGGKTGWFTGKLLQNLASPASKALTAIEPYSLPLGALSAEGGTLGELNSREGLMKLADALTPMARQQLVDYLQRK